jgi:hypothetical protein
MYFLVFNKCQQLVTYTVLSIPLYHAFKIFKLIYTSTLQERVFVLKNVELLKTLPLDSTNIMCPSIIDKYVKRNNFLFNISLIEFVVDRDTMDDTKRTKKSYNTFVHYNKHCDTRRNVFHCNLISVIIMRLMSKPIDFTTNSVLVLSVHVVATTRKVEPNSSCRCGYNL